jgi:hypothetical protein
MILRNFVLMKYMKLIGLALIFTSAQAMSQSLIGKWQGTYQLVCPNKKFSDSTKIINLFMRSLYSAAVTLPVTMKFKANGVAKRIIQLPFRNGRAKYKFSVDGTNLRLIDKNPGNQPQDYVIETLTSDSLVYSLMGNECQKFKLVRVK